MRQCGAKLRIIGRINKRNLRLGVLSNEKDYAYAFILAYVIDNQRLRMIRGMTVRLGFAGGLCRCARELTENVLLGRSLECLGRAC